MSAPVSSAVLPQYYIADGVHRAVAARENRLADVRARLVIPGQPDQIFNAPLDQLHSPKGLISRAVTSRRNYPALEAAMATAAGRILVPPIEVQPLGAAGQTGSVPLAQVRIIA